VPFFLALSIGVTLAVATAQDGDGTPGAERDLSDSERSALHEAARSTATVRRAEIVREFLASGEDVSDLRHIGSLVEYDYKPKSLDEAESQAVVVLHGEVTEQHVEVNAEFPSRARVVSNVNVREWFKGEPSEEAIELEQEGTPTFDGGEFVLRVEAHDPVLRKGAEVILFAEEGSANGRLVAIPYSTLELDEGGRLTVNELNTETADLNGTTLENLRELLREQQDGE
jgi:hypothetical protein